MADEMVPKAVVDVLLQQNAMLQNTIASLQAAVERLTAALEEKNQTILNQNRARFGQSSEKSSYVLPDGQMSMFEITGDGSTVQQAEKDDPAEQKPISVPAHTRKPKRKLDELCADLPVEEVICDLPEEERYNAKGEPLKRIGKECVRRELCRENARVWVKVYYSVTYADPSVEQETGYADILKAPTPVPLLKHSYASASVVTDVMLRKYADAMPLYRQEQCWKREYGVQLKRGTMANWMVQVANVYLKPFWELFRLELLKQPVIHADETVLQVLKEKDRKPTDESRMWVYASGKRAERQIRLFRYEASRAGACAEEMLEGFQGVLIADGYSGYNIVSKAVRAGCWAHMRRKWREAMPEGATTENSKAAVGYAYCSRLFEIERQLEKLDADERQKERMTRSNPIVDEYFSWLDTAFFRPSGNLKKAVTYAVNQKPYLCAFLEHGEIEISNNQVENAIRPLVVGRKNWLFSDTPEGAKASAIVYSLIETAKANGLNVERYLLHILTVLPDRLARDPKAVVDDLLPWTLKLKSLFQA